MRVDFWVRDFVHAVRRSWSFPGQATERALEVARRGLPIVSIDVECVAIGPKWNDREPGQVGLATATHRDGQRVSAPEARA